MKYAGNKCLCLYNSDRACFYRLGDLFCWYYKKDYISFNEAIANFGTALGNQTMNVLVAVGVYVIYGYLYENFRIFTIEINWWTAILLLARRGFCFLLGASLGTRDKYYVGGTFAASFGGRDEFLRRTSGKRYATDDFIFVFLGSCHHRFFAACNLHDGRNSSVYCISASHRIYPETLATDRTHFYNAFTSPRSSRRKYSIFRQKFRRIFDNLGQSFRLVCRRTGKGRLRNLRSSKILESDLDKFSFL